MVNKYLVGSSLLGLSNSKDLDYIILVENLPPKEKRPQQESCEKVLDIGYRTFNETKKRLDFVQLDWLTICNYQLDQDIIGQNFPIEYHILEHRKALISYLKKIKNEHLCNFHKLIRINKKYCSRLIYHVAYNIFILQNNSLVLTAEQRSIVQKIHDEQMPIEYLTELERMIDELE